MVWLENCPYCGAPLVNKHVCPDCSQVKLEDILYEIKKSLQEGKGNDLSEELKKKILSGNWRTMQEHLKRVKEQRRKDLDEMMQRIKREITLERIAIKRGGKES